MIPLDDNKINAKSTEITDLTYQYDDKKYLQKKTIFVVFFVCFFFPDLLIRMYFPTKTREPSAGSVFKIYICLESQILVCKTGVSKALHYVLGN